MKDYIDSVVKFFTEENVDDSNLIKYEIISRILNISQLKTRRSITMTNADYFNSLDMSHKKNLIRMINRCLKNNEKAILYNNFNQNDYDPFSLCDYLNG